MLPLLLALILAPPSCLGQLPNAPLYPLLCDPSREGCIKSPPGCRSLHRGGADASAAGDAPRCVYVATWRVLTSGDVEVEIGGQVDTRGGYVSLGFSPDKKASSGVALVCYKDSADHRVVLRIAGYRSGTITEFLTIAGGLIAEADSAPHFEPDQPQSGGSFYTLPKLDYGVIECRARLKLEGKSDPRLAFLQRPKDPYIHVTGSLGVGPPLSGDGLEKPTWTYTTPIRRLSDLGSGAGQVRSGAAKAHGCFMILAWVLCASIGTLLARYYKLQWPGRLLGREAVWFQLHRVLMAICCVLTLVSFLIIFIDLRGYSGLDAFPDLLHPILGIIVTALTFLNPLIALCRCGPADENRPCFNWIHWLIGTIAYVLAVFNLFLGLRLERAGDLRSIDYHVWLLIFFVLFQFAVEIILEIHTLYHWNRNKKRWQIYRQELIDYQEAKTDSAALQPRSRPTEPSPAGRCLRIFLLSLHAVVAAAVAFILCIVVLAY